MKQLIPKHPKRKRQPTAECMREQLRLAADEIIRLRMQVDASPFANASPTADRCIGGVVDISIFKGPRIPWWRRIFRSKAA